MTKIAILAVALLVAAPAAHAAEKDAVLLEKLRSRITAIDAKLDGVLGLSLKDLHADDFLV